jgi:hypothetical protein
MGSRSSWRGYMRIRFAFGLLQRAKQEHLIGVGLLVSGDPRLVAIGINVRPARHFAAVHLGSAQVAPPISCWGRFAWHIRFMLD